MKDETSVTDNTVNMQFLAQGRDARIGTTVDGKYTLSGLLGEGGMGCVYAANQHSMDREVAVKLLRPSYAYDDLIVQRFLHEAKVASRLSHPHVITVFDFGRTERNELYLVMELLRGRNLADIVKAEGPMAPDRAVAIAAQICEALHHAHEAELIHRDLKPENIFILEDSGCADFAKVLDFGLARSSTGGPRLTQTGMICGTPTYLSPEQARDEELDRRSDIYSLGVLLFEILSGRPPFNSNVAVEILVAHANEAPPALRPLAPRVSPELERVVMRALKKRPDDRYATVLDLRDALLAAVEPLQRSPRVEMHETSKDLQGVYFQPTLLGQASLSTLGNEAKLSSVSILRQGRQRRAKFGISVVVAALLGLASLVAAKTNDSTDSAAPMVDAAAQIDATADEGFSGAPGVVSEDTQDRQASVLSSVQTLARRDSLPEVSRGRLAFAEHPGSVLIAIQVKPASALVMLDGSVVGHPGFVIRPADGDTDELSVTAPGYVSSVVFLDEYQHAAIQLELKRETSERSPRRVTKPRAASVRPRAKTPRVRPKVRRARRKAPRPAAKRPASGPVIVE